MAVDVGEAALDAVVAVGEPRVVEAEQVEDRGLNGLALRAPIASAPAGAAWTAGFLPASPPNTPGRTRTCNPRFRRPMLYPIELRTPIAAW